MVEHRVSGGAGTFTHWLQELTGLLDPGGGWYGVFLRRDPEGIRACADGTELPPWDVVESLLQDFAALRGDEPARAQTVRARQLHRAAAADWDRRPGGRAALHARLDLMVREQARAADHARDLAARSAAAPEGSAEAGRLARDLAWLQDDHSRATARAAELRDRLASLAGERRTDRPGETRQAHQGEEPPPGQRSQEGPRPHAAPHGDHAPDTPGKRSRTAATARRRPRGARYAWLEDADQDDGPLAAPPEAEPRAGALTGARFGGAAEQDGPRPAPG
ncbi:UL36 very large tegument protein, partial [Streptomyces sp. MUM 203J]|nr:UL36 very large tegument protein [Streptomyces sp. MUM 203J]